MKYLLDTCTVSELIKDPVDEGLTSWIRNHREPDLFLSVVTLGEIQKGIRRLSPSRKKTKLQFWLDKDVRDRFGGRILPVDEDTALRWGDLSGEADRSGRRIPVLDGLIAATALVHGLTLVTRNEEDLRIPGVQIENPWSLGR